MELFNRRYLCLIAFTFLITSFFCCFMTGTVKIFVSALSLIAFSAFVFVFFKTKRTKFYALFSALLCLGVFISSLSSYVFVTRAEEEADSLLGENTVMVRIIGPEKTHGYEVRVLRVGDKEVDLRADLYIDIDENFEYGDELIMRARVGRAHDSLDRSKLIALTAEIDDSSVYLRKEEDKNYFSVDGLRFMCYSIRDAFGEFVDGAFEDYSGLVKGLLVNDKSDIDGNTELDFRRSGTLHILAVSGMHIAVLMGALEILLRKLSVKREIRIAVVSVFALLFLVLAAFAASAVRSVIMLYAVYLTYLFSEENDSITSLFVSIALIIMFSPFSVYDLGMWMSFLATLGILLVYPYFKERLPRPEHKNVFLQSALRLLVYAAGAVMLTVIANFFLLPIMWVFFGELSISAIPCNLILGPIVAVLMPLCAIATILSPIPYIGAGACFLTKRLIDVMMSVVEFFSEARFGVVSLRYAFVGVLVTLFSVAMIVLMIIKLKNKILIFAPMVAFALAFVSCFTVVSVTAETEIKYFKLGKSEFLFVNSGAECNVIDLGKNDANDGVTVANEMSIYATEIDNYFIVNPSKSDAATLASLLKNTIVRNLYIPKSVTSKEFTAYKDIFICAEFYNINVVLYDENINVEICNDVSFSDINGEKLSISSEAASIEFYDEKAVYTYGGVSREISENSNLSIELPFE